MTTIINTTPHAVNLLDNNGIFVNTFPKSDISVRLTQQTVQKGSLTDANSDFHIPLCNTVFGNVQGLPDYSDGVYYIVSQIVKTALPDRQDLLVPNDIVRDSFGYIVGCKSFSI